MRRAAVCLAAFCTLQLQAYQQLDVKEHRLGNGMKILVQEDHDIPNVALYLFFRVGSRNERPGITGISHFFEHMMFNGAKKYGPKQFDVEMEKAGGRNNAYTTRDVTVYTDWFPRTALELMMDMESDRIQNLAFDPKIIQSERGVVYSERRTSVDNSNLGVLYEQLNATAYLAHPYQWPVVGWASDIESWTMDDLKSHFRMGYSPNNCVAVVVGDVTDAEVLALAEKYLGHIPSHEPPGPVRTVEPPQLGERRLTVRKAAQLPIEMISYHVPRTTDKDWPALQVLGTLLAQGQSSRLYQRLVDGDQLALEIYQSLEVALDPGQLMFIVQPRSGVPPEKAEQGLLTELEKVRGANIAEEELQKAKNQLLADLYREMKTIAGKANLIGQYEVFYGDYHRLSTAGQDLQAVTVSDVRRVAEKYLKAENRTIATLVPAPEETK